MSKLSLVGVEKRFGNRTVLSELSLDLERSDVICLIGASGSGKSTLLRCINLLEPIDAGSIFLDDEDISAPGIDPDPIRRRIGMVFQSFNLFPHLTVAENIAPWHPARCWATPARMREMQRSQSSNDCHWPTRPMTTPTG